eukprot:PhF_6_TR23751/c0_g1_i6/m.33197
MCDEDLYSLFKADPCTTITCLVLHSIVENTHVSIPLDPLLEVIDYCALDRPLLDRVPNLTFEDALLHALPAVEERLQSAFRDFIATFSSHVVGNSTEEEPTRSMHLAIGALAANECLADMCEYLKPPKELGPYLKLLYRAYYNVVNVQNMYYGPATFHWKSLTTYDTDDYVHKSEFMWTRGPLVHKIAATKQPLAASITDRITRLFKPSSDPDFIPDNVLSGVVCQLENEFYIVSIPPMKFKFEPYDRFVKNAYARLKKLHQVECVCEHSVITPPLTWQYVSVSDNKLFVFPPVPVVCVSKTYHTERTRIHGDDDWL